MHTDAVTIRNLCKVYPNGKRALDGVNLAIASGDFYALLGLNGAGKSTTIGIMTHLINKTSGHVEIFGYDIHQHSTQAKLKIGVAAQEFNFNIFEKIIDVLIYQAGYFGISHAAARSRAEHLLKVVQLWDHRNNIVQMLSGGMKRRLMIARALMHSPQLLVLDEPTAGVDVELRRFIWDFLRELNREGTTILLTTHYLEEAEHLCNRAGIIHNGKIFAEKPMQELLRSADKSEFLLFVRHIPQSLVDMDPFQIEIFGEDCLKLTLSSQQTLSEAIQKLYERQCLVTGIQALGNRLESTMLQLTAKESA